MDNNERSVIRREKLRKFFQLAKSKGFHKEETMKPACIIAFSEQMEENYGDEFKALDKITELCQEYDYETDFIDAVLKLAGIE